MSTSFARASSSRRLWSRNGWYSTWLQNTGAISSACSQEAGGEVRHADVARPPVLADLVQRVQRLLERHVRVRPVQEQQVELVDAEPLQRLLRVALDLVGRRLVVRHLRGQEDLVARHAALGDPAPDLALVLVRARGVDLPVADLQRVADAVRRVLSGHQPRPVSDGRNAGRPVTSIVVMERVLSHCYAWQPPGRLAQLGERRLDKAEVTGSSPVSPIERSAFAGLLWSVVRDQFDPAPIGAAGARLGGHSRPQSSRAPARAPRRMTPSGARSGCR